MATTASNVALKREKVTPSSHPHTNEDEVEADDQVKVEENEVSPEETVGEEKEEEGVKQSNEGSEEIKPQEKQDQGKTTLAQRVYNDEQVKVHFGVKFWLCVSGCLDVREILKGVVGRDDDQLIRESGK
ncbi:hypothetical protein OIU78_001760 [Salix suchowensis]|nr:hypothetical protein OIU78_001760 [Salix suchowensis]